MNKQIKSFLATPRNLLLIALVLGGAVSLFAAPTTDESLPGNSSAESIAASKNAVAEFENLRPRSESTRSLEAAKNVKAMIAYQRTSHSSYNGSPAHIFYVDKDQYEVDAGSHAIVGYGPRPMTAEDLEPKAVDYDQRCGSKQLQPMALDFAKTFSSLPLEELDSSVSGKDDKVHFFRWSTKNKAFDGMPAFIQVGITCGGDVVSFANTLDLKEAPPSDTSGLRNSAISVSGVYVFANNGTSYEQYGPTRYWWTTNNEGYCSTRFANWCNPKYMRFTYESANESNHAYWNHPQSYVPGTHKIFIPRVNGTTRQASYYIHYGGASTATFGLDQLSYSDVWVQTRTLTSINFTHLSDVPFAFSSPSGKKIAFDEIQIVY